MSRPTTNSVHVDVPLSNISIMYKNGVYVADRIFPFVPVTKQSDKYYLFNKGDQFKDTAQYRAPGTSSNQHGFRVSTDSFFCEEIADSTKLEDETRDNADSVLRLETNKVNFVTNKILLKYEILVASLCTTVANWGSNYSTPSNLWDDYENSDPISDIETAIDAVEDGTGEKVNKMVISKDVWKVLKHHPQILARMSNDKLKVATLAVLTSIFEITDILIGEASKNTANDGQTASFSRIWSKDVWLGVTTNSPSLETATSGYSFVWKREGQMRGVRRWRKEDIHSDIIEAFMNFDAKVTGSDLGYVLKTVIS